MNSRGQSTDALLDKDISMQANVPSKLMRRKMGFSFLIVSMMDFDLQNSKIYEEITCRITSALYRYNYRFSPPELKLSTEGKALISKDGISLRNGILLALRC